MSTKYLILIFIISNLNYFTKSDAVEIKFNASQQRFNYNECHVIVQNIVNHSTEILNYPDFKSNYTGLTLIYEKYNIYSRPTYTIKNGITIHVQNELLKIKTINC